MSSMDIELYRSKKGVIMENKKFVLITSAKNEERHIANTIESVIKQTIRPLQWIIVSDGSTDNTDSIIMDYERKYNFIQYVRKENTKSHNFSSKVKALEMAYSKINVDHEFVGNLDADMELPCDYYEKILTEFDRNPKLGICGGKVVERFDGKSVSFDHGEGSVAGAIQLFRKKCFLQIGGYLSLSMGGEDAVAELHARMHNWEVYKCPEIMVYENRATGYQNGSLLRTKFKQGKVFYNIGYHPFFHFLKCLGRIFDKPLFLGSFMLLSGYFINYIRNKEILIPKDLQNYVYNEQRKRIKNMFCIN